MLTPRGAILLGASLALTVLGFIRVDSILITLGASGYLLLAGSFVLSRLNLKRVSLGMRAPSRIYADQAFDLRLIVRDSRTLLDAFGIRIDLKLAGQVDLRSYAPWTPAGSSAELRLRGSIPGRSAVRTHPYLLESVAPLGLFLVRASGQIDHQIMVFPRPLTPRELITQGALHDASLLPGMTPGQAPGELRGIRPWQPGDPAKHIHWPASARSLSRGRGLRIRENDPPGFYPQHCTVLFHSFGMAGQLIRADRFEWALSLTCGTLRYLREHGIPTTFLADFNDWKPVHVTSRHGFANLLVSLARASRRRDTEAHDLAPVIDRIPEDHSLVVLSDMPPDTWIETLPRRPAVAVDVRQHKYGARKLQVVEQEAAGSTGTPAAPSP